MKYEYLLTFIVLAECRNFNQTARRLSVVQSTVSSRIKLLEDELGCQLCKRDKQGVSLTKIGEEFLDYAIKMVEMEEYLKEKIKFSTQYKERLTIMCSHYLFDSYISDYIIQYTEKYPNISLKASIMHSEEILTVLKEGKIDLAYTHFPFHNEKYLCKPFVREKVVLVTNPGNNKYLATGITREELLKQPIVFSDIIDSNFEHLVSGRNAYPLDLNIYTKIVPFLQNRNWYSFLPVSIVAAEIASGHLIQIPLKGFSLVEKESHVVYRRNHINWESLDNWLNMFVFNHL